MNKLNFKEDQNIWIGIGLATFIVTGIGYYYYRKRKKNLGDTDTLSALQESNSTTALRRFTCTNKSYPLSYGTCHKDVKILQAYLLKMFQADLGISGKNKDGIDGLFGNKTSRAAKMHLQKTAFDIKDIEGIKTALKMIKR